VKERRRRRIPTSPKPIDPGRCCRPPPSRRGVPRFCVVRATRSRCSRRIPREDVYSCNVRELDIIFRIGCRLLGKNGLWKLLPRPAGLMVSAHAQLRLYGGSFAMVV
jgi:hypothetical protein